MKRIIIAGEEAALYDEESRMIYYRGKELKLPQNARPATGDTVEIGGKRGVVVGFNPGFLSELGIRGTQTIKPSDYSYMIARTGIHEGSVVLEAGCGAGQLTSALLWAIGSNGRLVSMDLKKDALQNATRFLAPLQDISKWEPREGDIRSASFTERFDAIFIDIPDPWNASSTLESSLKPGGFAVTYSPNFNQTEKTVVEFAGKSLSHIETCEILKRDILVRDGKTRPSSSMLSHTAFLSFFVKKSPFQFKV